MDDELTEIIETPEECAEQIHKAKFRKRVQLVGLQMLGGVITAIAVWGISLAYPGISPDPICEGSAIAQEVVG